MLFILFVNRFFRIYSFFIFFIFNLYNMLVPHTSSISKKGIPLMGDARCLVLYAFFSFASSSTTTSFTTFI